MRKWVEGYVHASKLVRGVAEFGKFGRTKHSENVES